MAHANDTDSASRDLAARRASLPADRAFVVQLRADVDLASGDIRGRVEHVTSGTAAVFESVEQLVSALRAVAAGRSPTERSDAATAVAERPGGSSP